MDAIVLCRKRCEELKVVDYLIGVGHGECPLGVLHHGSIASRHWSLETDRKAGARYGARSQYESRLNCWYEGRCEIIHLSLIHI